MRRFHGSLILAALLALSCSSPTGVDGSAGLQVASVSVDPTASTVVVGGAAPLHVSVMDADGNAVTEAAVVWTVRDAAIAAVSSTGVVTGRAVGTTQVAASSGGHSAVANITVQPPPVAAVVVQPSSVPLTVGQTVALQVALRDGSGAALTDRAVAWSSSNDAVARVSAAGVVTGVAVGAATITATSEGVSGTSSVTVAPIPVASVALSPAAASLVVGATTTLSATPRDAAGTALPDRAVTWTSSDVSVATVTSAGLVSAVGPGQAVITGASEGKSGTATVTVTAAPVASVSVEPATLTLRVGDTTPLTATAKDAQGNVLSGRVVSWSTSNPLVATVSTSGVVTAVAPGAQPATITATIEGKTGSTTATVTLVPVGQVTVQPKTVGIAVGQTTTLSVTVTDANGAPTNRPVTWTSGSPAVATVSANGAVTAVAPGQATITATSEGKSDAAVVNVAPAPVSVVTVLPANSALIVGQTTTLTATVKDNRGVIVTDRPVAWKSSNEGVATVTAAGVVTALSVGSATITATSEGKVGSALVSVAAVPVGSVSVSPPSANLFVAQTTVLAATVRDANGTVVTDRPVSWTTSNAGVATVSSTGLVTAVAPGSATISASAGTKSGSATIIVTLVPVGSVVLAPATATVIAGQATTLVPTVRDANGAVVTDRVISWTTSNPGVATVSATGVVTAVSPGDATITATSEGKSGNATITVIPVPVGSVTVAPATKSLVAGTTTTLVATVKDANGTTVTNRVVTWATSDPLVATVSATGVVTAVAPGAATITATSEGKSGSSAITVTPVPVASVTVQPATLTLEVGDTTTLKAVLKDAGGNVLTGRVVTWVSSSPLLASVSATGLVTALAPTSASPVFITATSEGWNGSAAVTVIKVPVGSVTLPATITLVAGQSTTLTPVVKDANGVVVTDRVVTWSSSNTNVASVSAAGVVKSLITGQATITATSEGKSASTQLTVTPAPVGSVTLPPSVLSLPSGSTVTLVPTVKDINGTTVTDRVVTWKSSDDNIATVSSTGVVTGLLVGTVTITATSEGKSGTTSVTVVPGPAATVTVTPPTASIRDGTTLQLTATAVDANGNAITGRSFSWQATPGSVASVSPSGRVTAKNPGTATVTATLDGKSDSSVITVTP